MDEIGDVEMEDVHTSKRARTQEVEEEEIETKLMETKPNQPGFQVTLEDPQQVSASSSTQVSLMSFVASSIMTEPSWPVGKAIEESNKKIREEMHQQLL